MNTVVALILFAVIGYILGWFWRDIRDAILDLQDRIMVEDEEPNKPGVTMGSYHHVDEVNPPVKAKVKARVITPKTPAKVEWDSQQALKEANQKFRVGPK